MENIVLFVTAVVLFCGLSESAECDGASGSRLQACILTGRSKMHMAMTATEFDGYCATKDSATTCIQGVIDDCAWNPKEQKMIALMVDIDALKASISKICENKTESVNAIISCTATEHITKDANCMENATGALTNRGTAQDSAEAMTNTCAFFADVNTCYDKKTSTCKVYDMFYAKVSKTWEYPYCGYSEAMKEKKMFEYVHNVTSSAISQYTYTVLSLVSVIAIPSL